MAWPPKMTEYRVTVEGVELIVLARYIPGHPGTRFDPPDEPEWDIEAIKVAEPTDNIVSLITVGLDSVLQELFISHGQNEAEWSRS